MQRVLQMLESHYPDLSLYQLIGIKVSMCLTEVKRLWFQTGEEQIALLGSWIFQECMIAGGLATHGIREDSYEKT